MWPLGIGVLSLVSIHDTMTACSADALRIGLARGAGQAWGRAGRWRGSAQPD